MFLPKAYFRLVAKSITIVDRLRGIFSKTCVGVTAPCWKGFSTHGDAGEEHDRAKSIVIKEICSALDVIVSYLLPCFDSLTLKDPLWR